MPTPGFKTITVLDGTGASKSAYVYDVVGDGSGGYAPATAEADGLNVTQGAKVDAPATTGDTTAWSVVALLKGLWNKLAGTLTVGGGAASGSAVAGNPNLVAGSDGTNARTIATDASGNQHVSGDVASGITDSGNPVKMGGVASSGTPTAVTAGQRQNQWLGLCGQAVVGTSPSTASDNGYVAGLLLDSAGYARPLAVGPSLYNGNNGTDRQRNNTDLTLLASAAHTTAQQSPDQTDFNGPGKVRVVLNVTAASGTGGLQVQIQGKDSISGNYYQLNATPTAVTANGTYVYDIDPSGGTAGNGITQVTQTFVGRTWRVNVAVGDASSYTYSISAVTKCN